MTSPVAALLTAATLLNGAALAKHRAEPTVWTLITVDVNGRQQNWVIDHYTRAECRDALERMLVRPAANVEAQIVAYCTDTDPRR